MDWFLHGQEVSFRKQVHDVQYYQLESLRFGQEIFVNTTLERYCCDK